MSGSSGSKGRTFVWNHMFLYMFNFYYYSQLLLLITKVGSYESMYQVHETKK